MVRKIEVPSTVGSVLLQQDSHVQHVPGDKPGWRMQQKTRNEHDDRMRDHAMLRDGFGGFYSQTAPSQKLADTAKRHLSQEPGQETAWKPCYKSAEQPSRAPKAFGKRFVTPPTNTGEEVPRGKKHVAPPSDSLGDEMALFQTRRRVTNEDTGVRKADEVSDMTVINESTSGRKYMAGGSRNGLPQATPGDKLYAHVQFSPDYIAQSNPSRARLGLEKPATRVEIQNTWAAKDREQQLARDICEVRSLPKYPKE